MPSVLQPDSPELRANFIGYFRDFFRKAEKKRRWSLEDDIPWDKVNKSIDPAVADVIETFCAVEMYLPDYVAKALPLLRANRGWAWFHVNWGYEEAKHSLALGDWLLRSGARTEEQMADLDEEVFAHEWNLPHESAAGMLIYAMIQELATWVNYRNLMHFAKKKDDPALAQILQLVTIDERAHHSFYFRMVKWFLELDREGTIEQLHKILTTFQMPSIHMLAQSEKRVQEIKSMGIFDEVMYVQEVYLPILYELGVSKKELRRYGGD